MELSKFLSICAMLFGVVATIFLSRALFTRADEIVRGFYHYSHIGWPSVAMISDKASQKADTLVSIVLVFLALSFQMISVFAKGEILISSSIFKGILLIALLIAIVSLVIYQVNRGAKNSYELEIKRVIAKDYVKDSFNSRGSSLYTDMEAIAKLYFALEKQPEEDYPDFVRRFAKSVGYELPMDADFSKFTAPGSKTK